LLWIPLIKIKIIIIILIIIIIIIIIATTTLGQVNIRGGIFQGDSLSPLLFIVILLPLTLVLRKMRLAKDMNPIKSPPAAIHG